jgi:hypothetical protein
MTMTSRAMASSLALTAQAASGGERTCDNDSDAFALSLSELANYHPVVIEGMGYYDPRDPNTVASTIVASIRTHLDELDEFQQPSSKPLLVIIQGDPLTTKGISAITPLVAESLCKGKRGLVCLDPSIDPTHSRNADRTNVVAEVQYSQLVDILNNSKSYCEKNDDDTTLLEALEAAIDDHISELNRGRALAGKPPVKDYFKKYALLQEVTKASLKELCEGSLTIAHTSSEINPFSVTSFYKVGLRLGLYDPTELVAYNTAAKQHEHDEPLDFDTIDPR